MPAIHWSCNEAKLDVISAWMLKDEKYSGILWNFDENRRNFDDPIYLFAHRRIHWIDRWPLIFEVDNNWRYFKNLYELNLCWFIVDLKIYVNFGNTIIFSQYNVNHLINELCFPLPRSKFLQNVLHYYT